MGQGQGLGQSHMKFKVKEKCFTFSTGKRTLSFQPRGILVNSNIHYYDCKLIKNHKK